MNRSTTKEINEAIKTLERGDLLSTPVKELKMRAVLAIALSEHADNAGPERVEVVKAVALLIVWLECRE